MPFWGKILEIDLSRSTGFFTPYPAELTWKILGGRGFNVWYLYHNVSAETDPLSKENILSFSCGVLTGTEAPVSSRVHVNALSPLTGLLGSSNMGGDFGTRLRSCGIQSLIIRGRSEKPVYLLLGKNRVEILDAQELWGLETRETRGRLQEKHKDAQDSEPPCLVTIGPAGENMARFACILADGDHAAGRTGMGAVMGSKNLKAIVIKGKKERVAPEDRERARQTIKDYLRQITRASEFKNLTKFGGAGYVKWADDLGILCTRNYRGNRFEEVDRLDGRLLESYVTRSKGCDGCPIRCKAELEFSSGKFKGQKGVRPEFEPMISLGSKCGLGDPQAVVFLDNLCSRLGLDNISAGSAIAFAMDLYDRGILTLEETGGLDLVWGNVDAMETLIRQMAHQNGLGAILSQGVRKAARIFGRGSERYAPHVKGLELAAYHPYEIMATALGYAVSNRGGDFNDIYASLEYRLPPEKRSETKRESRTVDVRSIKGKGSMVRRAMLVSIVLDCLGLCKVPTLSLIGTFDLEDEARLLTGMAGWDVDAGMLFRIGERIAMLERLFNFKHGADGSDDRLPDMFFNKEYTPGEAPSPPRKWMEPMKQTFYQSMGWDKHGWPKDEKLRELGLWEEVGWINELKKQGVSSS